MDVNEELRHVLRQIGYRQHVPHRVAAEVHHERVLNCEGVLGKALRNQLWTPSTKLLLGILVCSLFNRFNLANLSPLFIYIFKEQIDLKRFVRIMSVNDHLVLNCCAVRFRQLVVNVDRVGFRIG